MSFDPTIPNPGDLVLSSQVPLQNNFSEINNAFSENHIGFSNQNANLIGMHSGLVLDETSDPTTLSDEVALYTKIGTGGVAQAFFRPSSSGTPIQLTYQSTGTYNGSVNVTGFSGSAGTTNNYTVQVITSSNSFVLGDVVNFSNLVGDAQDNINMEGTVTVSGSTFTIKLLSQTKPLNGSLTSGTVQRKYVNCQSFYPGPYIVLFGQASKIMQPVASGSTLFSYTDYYPSSISFSSPPFVFVIPVNGTSVFNELFVNTVTNTGFLISNDFVVGSTNPTLFSYMIIGKP